MLASIAARFLVFFSSKKSFFAPSRATGGSFFFFFLSLIFFLNDFFEMFLDFVHYFIFVFFVKIFYFIFEHFEVFFYIRTCQRQRASRSVAKSTKQSFCKSGKQHKKCSSALCTMDDASYFLVVRLGPKTSEREKNVTVASSVTGCDVTNCATTLHGFNKHASSRREAVSDSRGVPRCTEKIPQNLRLLTRVDRSTRPTHHTFCLQLVLSLESFGGDPLSFRLEWWRWGMRTLVTHDIAGSPGTSNFFLAF